MPVVYFVGDEKNQQALGAGLNSGHMQLYAVPHNKPTEMIFIGGHRIDDAFEYALSERKIDPEYRQEAGRNVVVEHTLGGEYAKGITFPLLLPNKMVSVTNRIYQSMARGAEYDLLFIPSSCGEGCDAFFWLGRDANFGVRQYSSTVLGYDENEGAITSSRTVSIVGNIVEYYGMEYLELYDNETILHDVYIVTENCDTGCPYLKVAIAGAEYVGVSEDGGGSFAQINTAALEGVFGEELTANFTSIVYSGGNYVVGGTDVPNGVGTTGVLGYSVNGAAFVASTLQNSDGTAAGSLGINKLLIAFNKIWAFGTAGEVWYSCDNGVTFTLVENVTTETFLSAAFDKTNTGLVYLGLTNGKAFVFNGSNFTEISTQVGAGTNDLLSVAVTGRNHVVFGDDGGFIYSNYTSNVTSSPYTKEAIGSSLQSIGALAGDNNSVRVLAGVGAGLKRREALTYQSWENFNNYAASTVTALVAGEELLDEGVNYFLGTDADGKLFRVAYCNTCLDAGC